MILWWSQFKDFGGRSILLATFSMLKICQQNLKYVANFKPFPTSVANIDAAVFGEHRFSIKRDE